MIAQIGYLPADRAVISHMSKSDLLTTAAVCFLVLAGFIFAILYGGEFSAIYPGQDRYLGDGLGFLK